MSKKKVSAGVYTCQEYRAEMVLLSLNQRLNNKNLSDQERRQIETEIETLEKEMGM